MLEDQESISTAGESGQQAAAKRVRFNEPDEPAGSEGLHPEGAQRRRAAAKVRQ